MKSKVSKGKSLLKFLVQALFQKLTTMCPKQL